MSTVPLQELTPTQVKQFLKYLCDVVEIPDLPVVIRGSDLCYIETIEDFQNLKMDLPIFKIRRILADLSKMKVNGVDISAMEKYFNLPEQTKQNLVVEEDEEISKEFSDTEEYSLHSETGIQKPQVEGVSLKESVENLLNNISKTEDLQTLRGILESSIADSFRNYESKQNKMVNNAMIFFYFEPRSLQLKNSLSSLLFTAQSEGNIQTIIHIILFYILFQIQDPMFVVNVTPSFQPSEEYILALVCLAVSHGESILPRNNPTLSLPTMMDCLCISWKNNPLWLLQSLRYFSCYLKWGKISFPMMTKISESILQTLPTSLPSLQQELLEEYTILTWQVMKCTHYRAQYGDTAFPIEWIDTLLHMIISFPEDMTETEMLHDKRLQSIVWILLLISFQPSAREYLISKTEFGSMKTRIGKYLRVALLAPPMMVTDEYSQQMFHQNYLFFHWLCELQPSLLQHVPFALFFLDVNSNWLFHNHGNINMSSISQFAKHDFIHIFEMIMENTSLMYTMKQLMLKYISDIPDFYTSGWLRKYDDFVNEKSRAQTVEEISRIVENVVWFLEDFEKTKGLSDPNIVDGSTEVSGVLWQESITNLCKVLTPIQQEDVNDRKEHIQQIVHILHFLFQKMPNCVSSYSMQNYLLVAMKETKLMDILIEEMNAHNITTAKMFCFKQLTCLLSNKLFLQHNTRKLIMAALPPCAALMSHFKQHLPHEILLEVIQVLTVAVSASCIAFPTKADIPKDAQVLLEKEYFEEETLSLFINKELLQFLYQKNYFVYLLKQIMEPSSTINSPDCGWDLLLKYLQNLAVFFIDDELIYKEVICTHRMTTVIKVLLYLLLRQFETTFSDTRVLWLLLFLLRKCAQWKEGRDALSSEKQLSAFLYRVENAYKGILSIWVYYLIYCLAYDDTLRTTFAATSNGKWKQITALVNNLLLSNKEKTDIQQSVTFVSFSNYMERGGLYIPMNKQTMNVLQTLDFLVPKDVREKKKLDNSKSVLNVSQSINDTSKDKAPNNKCNSANQSIATFKEVAFRWLIYFLFLAFVVGLLWSP